MKQVNSIFVYGTLMRGFLKNGFPEKKLHIKSGQGGKINARLFDLGEYPGIRPTTMAEKRVSGELYEIDGRYLKVVLQLLDDYEDYYPGRKKMSLYLRKMTTVLMEDGQSSKAWVYWYNRPVRGKNEIEKGDYKKYLKRNK